MEESGRLLRLQLLGDSRLASLITVSNLFRERVMEHYGLLGSHFLVKLFDVWDLVRLLQEGLAQEDGPTPA